MLMQVLKMLWLFLSDTMSPVCLLYCIPDVYEDWNEEHILKYQSSYPCHQIYGHCII